MSLQNRVVLITGAAKGIGRAIALQAAEQGAKVVINYMSDVTGAQSLVEKIGADRVLAVQGDISKPSDIDTLIQAAISRFDRIDVLIPNATDMACGKIEHVTEKEFDRAFGVNVKGFCFIVQKSIPYMLGGSTIIFISSDVTNFNVVPPHMLLYIATKRALNQLVRVLARTLGKQEIRVNAISPGATGKESFYNNYTEESVRVLEQLSPFQKLGNPDEIAAAVSLLWAKENG